MYAFTPGQPLCLVYEDFYLAIANTFHEFVTSNTVSLYGHILANSALASFHPEMVYFANLGVNLRGSLCDVVNHVSA